MAETQPEKPPKNNNSTTNILLKGHLLKQGGTKNEWHTRRWKRRWFVLQQQEEESNQSSRFTLVYYKTKRFELPPQDELDLAGAKVIIHDRNLNEQQQQKQEDSAKKRQKSENSEQGSGNNRYGRKEGGLFSFGLSLRNGREIVLSAYSAADRAKWVKTLQKVTNINKNNNNNSTGWDDRIDGAAEEEKRREKRKRHGNAASYNNNDDDDNSPSPSSSSLPLLLVLEAIEGPFKESRFEIGREGVVIGRNPRGISAVHLKNLRSLQFPDDDISREHAEIRTVARGERFEIRDCGSLNGTKINGKRLSEERKASSFYELNGGDELELGKSKFSVFFRVVVPEVTEEERKRKQARIARKKQREEKRMEREKIMEEARLRRAVGVNSFGGRLSSGGGNNNNIGDGEESGSLIRPNAKAMVNILEGVISHNERLKQEDEEEEGGMETKRKKVETRERGQEHRDYYQNPYYHSK